MYSTLKMIFGNCPVCQIFSDEKIEVESIFDIITTKNGNYQGNDFNKSSFWRRFSQRIWQFDDFSFDGIAAASFLTSNVRFKVWFNPYQFYHFLYSSFICSNIGTGNNESDMEETQKIIEKILNEEKTDLDNYLNKIGLSDNILRTLKGCLENGGWDAESWHLWCNHVAFSPVVSENLISVMVHELQHIIWNHLNRISKKDPMQWNLATDFSINQVLPFSPEVAPFIITRLNQNFMDRMNIGLIKYLMKTDNDINNQISINFGLTLDDGVENFLPKIKELSEKYLIEVISWFPTEKFKNEPADFYYNILLETCVFQEMPEFGDSHEMWDDDDSGENDGDSDGDDEGKGNKESKDGKESDKSSEDENQSSQKGDGQGKGESHSGFDKKGSLAKKEAKNAVKETLERCGVNPNNPDALERALSRTPGMESLGTIVKEFFKVKTKNWRKILQSRMTSYMNPTQMDYTMSREDRRRRDVFPGKRKLVGVDVILAVDTSGSINMRDYNDFVNQIEKITKDCDLDKIRLIQWHHSISFDKNVPARKIKKIPIIETGGTIPEVVFEKLKKERNRKLLVIFSDCEVGSPKKENYKDLNIIWFASRGNEYNANNLKSLGWEVVQQDDE